MSKKDRECKLEEEKDDKKKLKPCCACPDTKKVRFFQ